MEVGRQWPESAMWKDANAFTQLSSGEIRDTRYTYWQLLNRSSRSLKWNAPQIFMHLQLTKTKTKTQTRTPDSKPKMSRLSFQGSWLPHSTQKMLQAPKKNYTHSYMCKPKSGLWVHWENASLFTKFIVFSVKKNNHCVMYTILYTMN